MEVKVQITGWGPESNYDVRSSDMDMNTVVTNVLNTYFRERSYGGARLPIHISIDTRDEPEISAAKVNGGLNEYLNYGVLDERMKQGAEGKVNINICRY